MAADEWHPISEELRWRGAVIDVRYNPAYLGGEWAPAHIAVHVVHPPIRHITVKTGSGREYGIPSSDALPITETGYRSHFCKPAEVEAAGGPAAFVRLMLESAAVSNKAWAKRFGAGAQLELF